MITKYLYNDDIICVKNYQNRTGKLGSTKENPYLPKKGYKSLNKGRKQHPGSDKMIIVGQLHQYRTEMLILQSKILTLHRRGWKPLKVFSLLNKIIKIAYLRKDEI